MINTDKIHTSYAPFQARTTGASFQHYLNASLPGAPHSKTFRFVSWIRNVDGDYTASRLRSAGKIAVASAAVFGMILTTPLVIGAVMLYKFANYNQQVSRELLKISRLEILREEAAGHHQTLINALGGAEACDQIPVIMNLNVYTYIKRFFTGLPTLFYPTIDDEKKQEILGTFEDLQQPAFQVEGHFLAILIEDKNTQARSTCIIHKIGNCASWQFLANANKNDETITGFGGRNNSETSLQTIADIVANRHDQYQLAQF